MNSSFFKTIRPHLVAIGIFLLVSVIYFSPVLSGKALDQHDINQWLGMQKEIADFRASSGQEPLWTGSMFSGMPAYQISVLYPANLMQYVNQLLWLWLPSPVNLLFLALLGFYLLMVSLKADFRIAIAGAFAYAFCSFYFVSIQAGHNSKVHAIALIPLIFAGILMAYRDRWLLGAAITALALSIQIYANHLQITYYVAITIGLLVLFELVRALLEKTLPAFLRASVALLFAAALAVLPNITNLWLTYEYGNYSTRSQSELSEKKSSAGLDKDYALGWSYGRLETMTLLIPGFAGGSSMYELDSKSETYKAIAGNAGDAQARSFVKQAPLYWGDQPMTSGPVYNGSIVVFLFILSLFLLKGPTRLWIASATLLFILLSWGRNFPAFTDMFFEHFPAYSKFRSVAMALVIASFMMPLAGMLALMKFTEGSIEKPRLRKALMFSFYIAGGISLLFALLPGLFCDFQGEADEQLKQYDWLVAALRQDRESILRADAFRSFFFIALTFGLLYAWLKDKVKLNILLPAVAVLILVDLWAVDKRYLNSDDFTSKSRAEQPFDMTPADQQILQDKGYYRVMNTTVSTFNDAGTSYFHRSIGGYHGAKLKRYQELIEYQISKGNINVLNMLNTKYFIVRNPQDQSPMVQMNPSALGPAWIVSDWKIVPNSDAEIKELDSLDTRNTAVIDSRYSQDIREAQKGPDSTASVRLISQNGKVAPNYLEYEVNGSKNNLVVFSEIHYPVGWNAYLDGKAVPHVRANYVLRAMAVPAGKHKVEFRFEPEAYRTGEKISLAGSVVLLLLFAGAAWMDRRRKD
ncbi:MAG: YfhO family protein [Bacteroidia bacterium]|nr:YfhO family protein [Bacteroidia bacterium]